MPYEQTESRELKAEAPWLSVIIPVYNGERYLRKCIDSVLAQTFNRFEVIVVDDGSTDGTPEICRAYARMDARISYIRIENHGPLHARITGLKCAVGEFFTFCDSDDYYLNSRVFQTLYDKCAGMGKPVQMLQFGFRKKYNHLFRDIETVKEDLYLDHSSFAAHEYPVLLCSFWEESHLTLNVWNKIYSRALIGQVPEALETLKAFWGDDLILNLHLLEQAEGVCCIPDVLYVYRASSGGTASFRRDTMDHLNLIKKYQREFLARRKGPETERMLRILYMELAGWFAFYLREAPGHLDEGRLRELILHCLELPEFQTASVYYGAHPEIRNETVDLLRERDPDAYIQYARRHQSRKGREKLLDGIKYIYRHI